MVTNFRLGRSQILSSRILIVFQIGFYVALWWFIFGSVGASNNPYRLRGGIYTYLVLISLPLFFYFPAEISLQKAALNRYLKVLLSLFHGFIVFFSGLGTLALSFILLTGMMSENTYVSPRGTHSITVSWDSIGGVNTVYRHNFLTEQRIGVIHTKPKGFAKKLTQIYWTEDESYILWNLENKKGVLKL
ncbi:MAG: hypothetical protein V7K86_22955 [Nostoc sp.]|uniref:hypothetical protein n=1 Tax=Nostoc sp. TaxID=1180 RepID=UPI002FF54F29